MAGILRDDGQSIEEAARGSAISSYSMRGTRSIDAAESNFSPMTSPAPPVSAATEHEHQHNNNQDQFHGNSPLMAMALFAAYQSIQQRLQSIVPDKRVIPQTCIAEV
jgi:hypothetical protein